MVSPVQMAGCLAQKAVAQMISERVSAREWEEFFVPPSHPLLSKEQQNSLKFLFYSIMSILS